MIAIGGIESNLNPASANPSSSARGLYQFMTRRGGSWDEYGRGGDVFDPAANTDAAMRYTKDNIDYFTSRLGRAPTPGETYLMHQQGRAGGVALLNDPTKNAVEVLKQFYSPEQAARAIALNGGRPDMTAGDFAGLWQARLDRGLGSPPVGAVAAPSSSPQQPETPSAIGNAFANIDEKKLSAALNALKATASPQTPAAPPITAPQPMALGPTPYAQALRGGILSGYLRS